MLLHQDIKEFIGQTFGREERWPSRKDVTSLSNHRMDSIAAELDHLDGRVLHHSALGGLIALWALQLSAAAILNDQNSGSILLTRRRKSSQKTDRCSFGNSQRNLKRVGVFKKLVGAEPRTFYFVIIVTGLQSNPFFLLFQENC